MDFALWQIALERQHFSCGTIDGQWGMRSRRALHHYQTSRNLPLTAELDIETRMALGKPGNPFIEYTVTDRDMALVQPTPTLWIDKSRADLLGYNSPWEMLSEKFHTTKEFLQLLNPSLQEIQSGTSLTAPNLAPSISLPKATRIEIILSQTTLLVYEKNNHLAACFPCSIAADKNKIPEGKLEVINIAENPNYTFNPAVLSRIAEQEGITSKLILPPGPNNPVGTAWMGLSIPGYGIHGTPDPEQISVTGSHGCFRLANWNANKLLRMAPIGTPVRVLP